MSSSRRTNGITARDPLLEDVVVQKTAVEREQDVAKLGVTESEIDTSLTKEVTRMAMACEEARSNRSRISKESWSPASERT